MTIYISEIINNFWQLFETDPILAAGMVMIGIVCVGAAALGLSNFGG